MQTRSTSFILIAISVLFFINCSRQKTIITAKNVEKITVPSSLKEYKTDESFIRVISYGINETSEGAKSSAINIAKDQMTERLTMLLSNVIISFNFGLRTNSISERYWNNRLIRNTVNKVMLSLRFVDSFEKEEPNRKYIYWIVMDVPKAKIKDNFITEIDMSK